MGRRKQELPLNNVKQLQTTRKTEVQPTPVVCKSNRASETTQQSTLTNETPPEPVNYVSDDEDDEPAISTSIRRSRRILSQRQPDEHDTLHRIVALSAKETATVPAQRSAL